MIAMVPLAVVACITAGVGYTALSGTNATSLWNVLLNTGIYVEHDAGAGITFHVDHHKVLRLADSVGAEFLARGPFAGQIRLQSVPSVNGTGSYVLRAPREMDHDLILSLPAHPAVIPGSLLANDGTGTTYWVDPQDQCVRCPSDPSVPVPGTPLPTSTPLPTNGPVATAAPAQCECTAIGDGALTAGISAVNVFQSLQGTAEQDITFMAGHSVTIHGVEGNTSVDGTNVHIKATAANVTINATTSGFVKIQGLAYPSVDGEQGEHLTTNGHSQLEWRRWYSTVTMSSDLSGTTNMSALAMVCTLVRVHSQVTMDCVRHTFDMGPIDQSSLNMFIPIFDGFRPTAGFPIRSTWVLQYAGVTALGFIEISPEGSVQFWRDGEAPWAAGVTGCGLSRGTATWITGPEGL
ncbi:MAG: hypothetical protein JKY23_04435 [Nitrospinaceae bacterium]|nr:hypothetical protein [Nitrospinaceae bacterium]